MTATLVDSNVLLDVLGDENAWTAWSAAMLARVGDSGRLIINPIVYGEVSVRFSSVEALDERPAAHGVLPGTVTVQRRLSRWQGIPRLSPSGRHKAVAAS